jgi:predicted metal-dependent enzyme (double-stranded beta helix superfamily)
MINATYENDFSVVVFETCRKHEVGEVVITNKPGHCGHNYAHWSVVSITKGNDNVFPFVIKAERVA